MKISKRFLLIAERLQEAAALNLSHNDLQSWLSDACQELGKGTDSWCYMIDFSGTDQSGDVVLRCDGDTQRAPYTVDKTGGKVSVKIDMTKAVNVLPRTVWELEATEKGPAPSVIPPTTEVEKQEAALLDVVGDLVPLREGAVGQDGSAFLKLIAPGWGSSGYYGAPMLERDGPKVFPKGTKNFWNHQTEAEEDARPEGDLRDLASVLTEDAKYDAKGPAGPGLYAKAKVFEDFRQPVDDLAKHIGMSIRATGKAKEGKAEGKTGPIIEELTRGISVDYVTSPGAGGQVLQLFEAARKGRNNPSEEVADEMDAAELKKLQESVAASNARALKANQRLALMEARDVATKKLATVRLPDATKQRLVERLTPMAPMTIEGELDTKAFDTLIEAEVKDEAAYLARLTEGRIVTGMGSTAEPVQLTEAQQAEEDRRIESEMDDNAESFGMQSKEAKRIFNRGRSAFQISFNSGAESGRGVEVGEEV